jgi:hypothetical protein
MFPPPGAVKAMTKRLQFVVAHELTHVFDMLRLLIPALKNWRKFWHNVLEEGQRCEDVVLFKKLQAIFVDDYGSKNELDTVKQYWPSRAEEWFAALRGKSKRLFARPLKMLPAAVIKMKLNPKEPDFTVSTIRLGEDIASN